MYVNSKVDKILEDVRTIYDAKEKQAKYEAFEKIIQDEVPAIFLYSPEYVYAVPEKLQGLKIDTITNPSDRWYGAEEWYIATDHVWRFFRDVSPGALNNKFSKT